MILVAVAELLAGLLIGFLFGRFWYGRQARLLRADLDRLRTEVLETDSKVERLRGQIGA